MMLERLRRLFRRTPAHLRLGEWGEHEAERHLRALGIRILGRRVRVGKHDEIDLLAREGNVLVIVEVKTRSTEGLFDPRKAVNAEKRYRLSRAAARYARPLRPPPDFIRFDIVEVIGVPGTEAPRIRHHPAAFRMHPAFRL
jgi:putative endonuclease